LILTIWVSMPTWAQDRPPVIQSEKHAFHVVRLLSGLENPWSMVFLPDGRMLVTERAGRLRLVGQDFRLEPKPH
jgi:glucose/arabinose dehydrogenase